LGHHPASIGRRQWGSGSGVWHLRTERKRRTAGRNPQSGEAVTIAASKTVRFKLAAPFKAQLNGG